MISNAGTGLRWLDRATLDVDEAKVTLNQIVIAGHRAETVIESIRAIFKKDVHNRTSLDINELVREALALMRSELQKHGVSVQAEPNERLPGYECD